MQMPLVSPCKINLNLNVFQKNMDGFHRLQTLMVRVGVFDHMEIAMDDSGKIAYSGASHLNPMEQP